MRIRSNHVISALCAVRAPAALATFVAISVICHGARAEPDSTPPVTDSHSEIAQRLISAYPDFITAVESTNVKFRDGSSIPLDDGRGAKSNADWLANPDIEDMFRYAYPAGAPADAPAVDFDPGRARNDALFAKMYGDCRKGETQRTLVAINWLGKSNGAKLKVTPVNGVAERLKAVSSELAALPAKFRKYLEPAGGTFVCRQIAGTSQRSAHGYGIAIDIATGPAHYWRWAKGGPSAPVTYRNSIPMEIVAIFEKHGFIWGGRWYHYDTMHFEYRPELLLPQVPLDPAQTRNK